MIRQVHGLNICQKWIFKSIQRLFGSEDDLIHTLHQAPHNLPPCVHLFLKGSLLRLFLFSELCSWAAHVAVTICYFPAIEIVKFLSHTAGEQGRHCG